MKRAAPLLIVLALAGCRVLSVSIGEAPPEFNAPSSSPAEGIVVAQAYTALPPGDEEPTAEVFLEQPPELPWYVVLGTREVLFQVNWFGYWEEGVFGGAEVYAELFGEPVTPEAFEVYAEAGTGFIQGEGPIYWNNAILLPFEAEEVGRYAVQISIFAGAGESSAEQVYSTEVVALSHPAVEFPIDGEPRFGEVEAGGFLLDWRGWQGGPCRTSVGDPGSTRSLDDACLAGDDAELLAALLTEALDGDLTPEEQAVIRGQAGLAYAVTGDWEVAARQFREALALWEQLDDAYRVALALHNLGVAELELGQPAEPLLVQALDLRDHIEDFPGFFLTWAQLGIFWGDPDILFEAAEVFDELDWPQADTIRDIAE